jgi:hypothetical protein
LGRVSLFLSGMSACVFWSTDIFDIERDPVTGRGKYTGMTKEETIEYVRRTRYVEFPVYSS